MKSESYKGNDLEVFDGKCGHMFVDHTHKRFGGLYVIARAPNQGVRTMYWVECSCGSINKVHATHLVSSGTGMCKECADKAEMIKRFSGVGDIPYAYWAELTRRATGEKSGRKSRVSLEFDFTIEDGWEMFQSQNGKCALSGIDIKFVKYGRSVKATLKSQTASLDRIDSSKGYTKDNVQWVHKDINRMKNVYSDEYFIEMCVGVAKTRGSL